MLGEVARAVEADHGHDPTGEERLDDLALLVRRGRSVGHGEPGLVTENLRLELLELGPGSIPSSSMKRARASW